MTGFPFPHTLPAALRAYGVPERSVRLLRSEVTVDTLAYKDLITSEQLRSLIPAVVEDDEQPLMYIVQAAELQKHGLSEPAVLRRLSSQLACRGADAYLCVLDWGKMTVYPCQLDKSDGPLQSMLDIGMEEEGAFQTFQTLVQGNDPRIRLPGSEQRPAGGEVRAILKKILLDVCDNMMNSQAFGDKENEEAQAQVLALVGRALFTRFLADRNILTKGTFKELYTEFGGPEEAFSSAASASALCYWLDKKFNGELLPISGETRYEPYFAKLLQRSSEALRPLSQIMYKEVNYQVVSLWSLIDFAHVPAGLLSEVYEVFLHKYGKEEAHSSGAYYTPQHLAHFMVRQAFSELPEHQRSQARLVDPAAGAGVFLVLGLQELYLETWKATGTAPDTAAIRRLLYEQLKGFDLNHHAVSLSALSLYLTAIELDPEPDPSRLLFNDNLIGTVLHDLSRQVKPRLGTLATDVLDEHAGTFDIVIGNPPWTAWRDEQAKLGSERAKTLGREVLQQYAVSRQGAEQYQHPDRLPDIAFLWGAMRLARPGGVLALLMHARLLFGTLTAKTRELMFQALNVKVIVNGSNFSDETTFWPVRMPFVMLFAEAAPPSPQGTFLYVSPFMDSSLARRGKLRIDPLRVNELSRTDLLNHPHLLRVLACGTMVDYDILSRFLSRGRGEGDVNEFRLFGDQSQTIKFTTSIGYIKGSTDEIVDLDQENSTEKKSKSYWNAWHVELLRPKPHQPYHRHLNSETLKNASHGLIIERSKLPKFPDDLSGEKFEKPRNPKIYRGPMAIMKRSPVKDQSTPLAYYIGEKGLSVYSGSFIGIHTNHEDERILKLIVLIMNSEFVKYYFLMTSPHFGIDIRYLNTEEMQVIPLPDLPSALELMHSYSIDEMMRQPQNNRKQINDLIYKIYNISNWDITTIRNTLEMNLPYETSVSRANNAPTNKDIEAYFQELNRLLKSTYEVLEKDVRVSALDRSDHTWWRYRISLAHEGDRPWVEADRHWIRSATEQLAEDQGQTVITHIFSSQTEIGFSILAQARYWTVAHARFIVGDVVNHLS